MSTGYTYDPTHTAHAEAGHPERPERLERTMALLAERGALEGLTAIEPAEASHEALERVHPEAYLGVLEAFCARGGGRLDADTYATAASFEVARRAAGGLLRLTDAVLEGELANGFALPRPPGHHARPLAAMGFCLLSNVALAARHAQAAHGLERVMIVDFDVHHGNGTQEAFEADPSVLVVSSHRFPFYPGTGALEETGAGPGEGATVNIPLPAGTADAELLALYRRLLPPLAARFRPELVLVSAGYDAHRLDPLGDCSLSVRGLTDLLLVAMEVAEAHASGRLVATLEGGYDVEALAQCVLAAFTVLQDPAAEVEDPFGPASSPGPSLAALTEELLALHGL